MNGSGGGRVVESGVARWRGIEIVGGRAVESNGEGWRSLDSGGECYKMVLRDEDGWIGNGGRVYLECGTDIHYTCKGREGKR